MKKIFMFLLLTSAITAFAQVPYDDAPSENEVEAIYPDDNYESEMFLERQEDQAYASPSEDSGESEDLMAEEVYHTESDYNY